MCVRGLCCSPAHPSLSRVSPGVEGCWVLESGVWRVDPGRGHLLSVKRQPEGTGARNSTTGKVCGSPGHCRSKAPLLSGAQGRGGQGNPLPHPSVPASTGTGRVTHLSRIALPSSQGPLCLRRLRDPEHCLHQSLLGNQPWAPQPETGIGQGRQGLSAKAWG